MTQPPRPKSSKSCTELAVRSMNLMPPILEDPRATTTSNSFGVHCEGPGMKRSVPETLAAQKCVSPLIEVNSINSTPLGGGTHGMFGSTARADPSGKTHMDTGPGLIFRPTSLNLHSAMLVAYRIRPLLLNAHATLISTGNAWLSETLPPGA